MPTIRQLSQSLINKIAAGEVIERPASVVKELMENAVDAGSTRIDVSIKKGGIELIRVADNGCGIADDQLELAVASHATSKIETADDLFRVDTLGFRGEALASIASVSQLSIRSRTAENESGAEIEILGGQSSGVVPCGCPRGTTVEVRNLFHNTPVRRKFLRTVQTEFGHISEAFNRIALAAPKTHFTLRHNERTIVDLPGSDNWLERMTRLFGRDLADHLIPIDSTEEAIHLSGYVAHPSHSRSNNRMQYFFLNGRFIRDRALQHALSEAYRGLLLGGRYPIALLALSIPADTVDVNVHPTKLEVRFQDSGRLYRHLLSSLRTKFLATDLNTQVSTAPKDPSEALDEGHADQLRQQVVDWAKGEVGFPLASGKLPDYKKQGQPASGDAGEMLSLRPLDRNWSPPQENRTEQPPSSPGLAGPPEAGTDKTRPSFGSVQALQIHNRYLVTETTEGVMVIDQHALHERILYEHLRQHLAEGEVESQTLLVPEPVDLSPSEKAVAMENRELLATLGMQIEPFGGETILVSGYPAMLTHFNPGEVLHALIDQLLTGVSLPDRRDLMDEMLHTIACKAAIKAGDRLASEEIDALLEQRHLIHDAHHCPHGRPSALVFTREELDKRFKRT